MSTIMPERIIIRFVVKAYSIFLCWADAEKATAQLFLCLKQFQMHPVLQNSNFRYTR